MKVPFLEKVGYSLGDGAANLVFQLMMMFQLMFYTDVLGIGAGAAGAILLGARVFDAFIDPLAGILGDRTKTKWGKYRPWVVGTAMPFAVVFLLSYLSPDWGERAKIAWAASTYALLMALYSFNNTPYSSLGGVMTDDGRYVELQGTAEHEPFTEEELAELRSLARGGLKKIFSLQRSCVRKN